MECWDDSAKNHKNKMQCAGTGSDDGRRKIVQYEGKRQGMMDMTESLVIFIIMCRPSIYLHFCMKLSAVNTRR